jgi:hypothetical protein
MVHLVKNAVDPIAELSRFTNAKMLGQGERRFHDRFEVETLFDRKTGKGGPEHRGERMVEANKPSNGSQELPATVIVQRDRLVYGKAAEPLYQGSFAESVAKDFVQGLPCLTGLERAIARGLFFGVFSLDLRVGRADPDLNQEGVSIEAILFKARELLCVFDAVHQRQAELVRLRAATLPIAMIRFGVVICVFVLILILIFHADIVASSLGQRLSK